MWLEFETRMRKIMKGILAPTIEMCAADREAMFEIEITQSKSNRRLELLDRAVFKMD
jgi:hypothetical protein